MHQERKAQLERLIKSLKLQEIGLGQAERFARVGEWSLAFVEIFHSVNHHKVLREELREELDELNNYFSEDPYSAKHLGYPLNRKT